MKLLLTQLSRLHAYSYHFVETYFGGLSRFQKDFWYMCGDDWLRGDEVTLQRHNQYLDDMIEFTCTVLGECQGTDPGLVQKLREFKKVRKERMEAVAKPSGEFLCVNHGDAWVNNFMFKYA